VVLNITKGNVLLIEKDKIRTEENRYMRFTFLESANRLGLSNAIIQQYDKLSFVSVTGSRLDVNFDDFELGLIDLGKLNRILKNEIKDRHEIREDIKVLDVNMDNNKVNILASENGETQTISSKYLVDASGCEFLTRKKFNLGCSELLYHCLAERYKNSYENDQTTLTFFFPSNEFSLGGWKYPFGIKDCVYGIGGCLGDIRNSLIILDTELRNMVKNSNLGSQRKNVIIESKQDIGSVPIGISQSLVYNSLCYVGDSFGQATAWMGEGIRPIIEASIICGKTIDDAIRKNGNNSLKVYSDRWHSTYYDAYKNYHYMEKWNRSLDGWEKTLKKMSKIAEHDKKQFIELLMYDNMSKDGKEYLKKLKSKS